MKKVTLGEISLVLTRGKAPQYDENGTGRIVKSAQVQPKAILWDKCPNVSDAFALKFKKTYGLRNDDILLNGTGTGTLGRPGFVCDIPNGIYVPDSHVNLIRVDEAKAFPKFVFHWLNSPTCQRKIALASTGSTNQIELSAERLSKISVPLPSLAEQIHIAQVLDQADRLRKQDQQLLAHYDQLVQAVFMHMFGDPVRNEKRWKQSKVIDYCSCIVPGRDKPKSFSGGTPWITTGDLLHLGFTDRSRKDIGLSASEIHEVNARVVPAGSVIMTCVGELGIVSIINEDSVINQQLHAFQCEPEVNNIFLMHCLSYQKAYMEKMASSTTIPYMNKTVCNSVPVIIPPIALQNRFAEVATKAQIQKTATQQLQAQSEALFNSLLQQAFRGELTRPELAARPGVGQLSLSM